MLFDEHEIDPRPELAGHPVEMTRLGEAEPPVQGDARRRLSPPSDMPIGLLELTLPGGAEVAYPPSAYAFIDQQIWVLEGTLRLTRPASPSTSPRGTATRSARRWRARS
jgi:hypothetical protein